MTPAKKYRLLAVIALVAVGLWGTHDRWGGIFANASAPTTEPQTKAENKSTNKQKKPKKGVPVIVDAVSELRDVVLIEAIGTARAVRSVTLYPETEGEIVKFPVKSGEAVKKNAVVLQLDNRNANLAVRVARTHVKEAESALQRAKRLRENNVRSKANVEDAEFVLERAELELAQAREDLADRTLRAPFDGIVGIPKVEVGDRVTSATEIITIDDRTTLLVEMEVAERFLSRLSLEAPLVARTPSFPDRVIEGKIVKIDSRVDPTSRTVLVRAGFENNDDSLRPGMSFFVNFELQGEMFASIPELALQWRDGESYVWRITNGKSDRVAVTTKRRLNDKVLVNGDIAPGDLIVVEGVQRLRNGRRVEISAADGAVQ